MEEKTQERDDTLSVYELSYLLLPSLALEQVPGKAASLKSTLTSLGGTVISDEDPVLIDLAYPMTKTVGVVRNKVANGYFGWVKFEISKEGIEKVKKAFDSDLDTVRYLIIRTVRENTLLNGKMKFQREDKSKKDEYLDEAAPEVLKETVPEELDKSIDDLVIA